jgi:cell division septation protein DedD
MPSRDSQTVILSRQTILMVTAVGVGLLTLCYVLGVQVGKQSAALRRPAPRGAGEDLQELPAAIDEQLKALASAGADAMVDVPPPAATPAATPAAPPPDPAADPRPTATATAKDKDKDKGKDKPKAKDSKPAPVEPVPAESGPRWTLQLISTPDQDEAQRMAGRVRAAGFPAGVIIDKGLFKVRLVQSGPRDAVDATAVKLKNRGFKPFAMKVD